MFDLFEGFYYCLMKYLLRLEDIKLLKNLQNYLDNFLN